VDAKLLPAVGKFARYLTNDANQLAFAKQASVYPAMAQAANDPFFTTVPPALARPRKPSLQARCRCRIRTRCTWPASPTTTNCAAIW
jgi:ABC-type glycerol-3-phosphate transport system substrate-binding protein